jgi:hypothetical protein
VPGDDLGLIEAFAEVGQKELAHAGLQDCRLGWRGARNPTFSGRNP